MTEAEFHNTLKNKIKEKSIDATRFYVEDGAFSNYYAQELKILFIGSYSYSLGGMNMANVLEKSFENGKIGERPIDGNSFWRRLLKIVYMIESGIRFSDTNLDSIPTAREIAISSFSCNVNSNNKGISFALINTFKFDKEICENYDYHSIIRDLYIENHSFNPIYLQISQLNPDLIISMNQKNYLQTYLKMDLIYASKTLEIYKTVINNKETFLFDTIHFSAHTSDVDNYFSPITEACKNYGLYKNLKKNITVSKTPINPEKKYTTNEMFRVFEEKTNFSRSQICAFLGIKESTLKSWINPKTPNSISETASRIIQILDEVGIDPFIKAGIVKPDAIKK